MARMTPEREAAYALDWDLPREDLGPAVQAEYDRLKTEREAAPQYIIGPPRLVSEKRPQAAWVYLVPAFLLWAGFMGVLLWVNEGPHITGSQVNFSTLRSDVSQVRLPAGYARVSSAESGRHCAQNTCVLTQFWEWRGSTARSVADACRDIDRAMSARNEDVEPNSPLPRGAACEYFAVRASIVHAGQGKREVEAFVWTDPRAAGSPGGYQVELLAAYNYAGP